MNACHFQTIVHPLQLLPTLPFIITGERSAHLSRPIRDATSFRGLHSWVILSLSLWPAPLSPTLLAGIRFSWILNLPCLLAALCEHRLYLTFFFFNLKPWLAQQLTQIRYSTSTQSWILIFSLMKVYLIRLMVANATSLWETESAWAQSYPWGTRGWDFSQNPHMEA